MENKLSDYLHLYLGSEIEFYMNVVFDGKTDKVHLLTAELLALIYKETTGKKDSPLNLDWAKILIHCRPLYDITMDEHVECSLAYTTGYFCAENESAEWFKEWHGECERTRYLLSKGFDLFGLIESGLAIDKTTLTK